MLPLFRSELFRIQKRTQTWILSGLVTLAVILFYGGFTIAHFVRPDSTNIIESLQVSRIYDNGLGIAALISTIMVVIFSSSLIGSEYGWNTLRPVLARARSRVSLLSAKWATVALYVVLLSTASVIITILASAIGSMIAGEPSGLQASTVIDAVEITARYAMALAPSAALAMFVALALRSNAAGIAIGIAFTFVEPLIFALLGAISDVFKTIEKGGISWNANRLTTFAGNNDITAANAWTSAGVLALWVLLFVALSYRIFTRRDVTSG
jgi:ABC-2 type transport system permease protein